jgi:hypothetical protein
MDFLGKCAQKIIFWELLLKVQRPKNILMGFLGKGPPKNTNKN